MDWGRAKTILILSFLFLNLLLVYQMWVTRWDPAISSVDSAEMKREAIAVLTGRKIRIQTEIPTLAPKLQQISVSFADNSSDPNLIVLKTPLPLFNRLNTREFHNFAAKTTIKSIGSYAMDPVLSNDSKYVYNQVFEHLPMFDITLQLFANKSEITGYKQSIVAVQSEVSSKASPAEKVITAYTALESVSGYLPAGSVISDVRLGYHGQNFDSATYPLLPYWRIALNNGSYFYVQAFTGAVEGNQNQLAN